MTGQGGQPLPLPPLPTRQFRHCLEPSKSFSEILPPKSLSPGPVEVRHCRLNDLHLRRHSQTIRTPQPNNFFACSGRRRAASFEPLNSSPPLSAPELRVRKATCDVYASHVQSTCFGARIPETNRMSNKKENAADEILTEETI